MRLSRKLTSKFRLTMRVEIAPTNGLPGAPVFKTVSALSLSRPLRSIHVSPSASDATWTPQRKLLISFIFAPLLVGPR